MSEAATNSQPTSPTTADSLTSYTRSLHDYTLALWTESRRVAEEKARAQGAANTQPEEKPTDGSAQQAPSPETQK